MRLRNDCVIANDFPVGRLAASALLTACGILCTFFNFASDVLQQLLIADIGNTARLSAVLTVLYALIAVSGVSPLGVPFIMTLDCAFGFALACAVRTSAVSMQILSTSWTVGVITVFLLTAAFLMLSVRAGSFSAFAFKRIRCDVPYRSELLKYCLFSFITVAIIISLYFAAALLI